MTRQNPGDKNPDRGIYLLHKNFGPAPCVHSKGLVLRVILAVPCFTETRL